MREIRVGSRHERTAIAELDEPRLQSDTIIIAKIRSSCGERELRALNIEVRDVPDGGEAQQLWLDLLPVDFRSLLATLEAAIIEAELCGILPRDPESLTDRGYSVAGGVCDICQTADFEHAITCTHYLPDVTHHKETT